MSRIGKTIRKIPAGVNIEVKDGVLIVKGPKGELKQKLNYLVTVQIEGQEAKVIVKKETDKTERALWGTYSSLLQNMIVGVTEGFKKQLEINGVGYKVALNGKNLKIEAGYSHPVEVIAVPNITFTVEKNLITIEGIDKQVVGEVSANIRSIRKPEPYKGKGIKYIDEILRRKAGKTAASS